MSEELKKDMQAEPGKEKIKEEMPEARRMTKRKA